MPLVRWTERCTMSTAPAFALIRMRQVRPWGFRTNIHLRAAGDKQLMTFVLTPGQGHETVGFAPLMAKGAVKHSG